MPKKGERKPSQLLKDMRHVYRTGPESDRTEGQRMFRALKEGKPAEFLSQLAAAEKAYQALKRSVNPSGGGPKEVKAEVVDEGTAAAKGALEEFLRGLQ